MPGTWFISNDNYRKWVVELEQVIRQWPLEALSEGKLVAHSRELTCV
jgi:hypothetical protein